jgi:ABC-2 type transport system permease protein
MVSTAIAFIKRDFLQDVSYKASFILKLLSILFTASVFYFVSGVFEGTGSAFLKPFGGQYFPFALIGIALLDYHTLSLQVFSNSIRDSQMMGTMEIMLLSPTRLSAIILYSSLWGYLFTSFRFLLYLCAGVILFGLQLSQANLVGAFLVLLLSIPCFAGLGIMNAGVIMLIKEASSLNLLLGSISLLLGGVVYPVDVLPVWLRPLSLLIPVTHALNAMRQALLQGYSVSQLWPEISTLLIFATILLPLGFLGFHFAVQRAKVTGTLGHY